MGRTQFSICIIVNSYYAVPYRMSHQINNSDIPPLGKTTSKDSSVVRIRNDFPSVSSLYQDRHLRLRQRGLGLVLGQLILGLVIIFISIVIYQKSGMQLYLTQAMSVLSLSSSITQIRELALSWKETVQGSYFMYTVGFCLVYILLQTFAIPGTSVLNILAGYFHLSGYAKRETGGSILASILTIILCSSCAAIGSSCCYLLSLYCGKGLVSKWIGSDRLQGWHATIQQHKPHLFFYFIFIRVTPFIPNWFANLSIPHLTVPLHIFFLGTLFGVMPITWIQLQVGVLLEEYTAMETQPTLWTFQNILLMVSIASFSLLPPLLNWIMRSRSFKASEAIKMN